MVTYVNEDKVWAKWSPLGPASKWCGLNGLVLERFLLGFEVGKKKGLLSWSTEYLHANL